jgi:hypothetical protein
VTRIFISYSRVDKTTMKQIAELLKYGYDNVWYDTAQLLGGEDWWKRIVSEIEKCNHFIFLMSPESVNSEYCIKELNKALELNKHIIPVRIRDRTPYPDIVKDLHTIDAFDDRLADGISRIYAAIVRNNSLNTNSEERDELTEAHRQADLRLLKKLWVYINSVAIETLDNQAQWKQIEAELYNRVLFQYPDLRNKPENHFNHPNVESWFKRLDETLSDFRVRFGRIATDEKIGTSKFYIVEPLLAIKFDMGESKEYDDMVDAVLDMRRAHNELVNSIRKFYPEFDFTVNQL